MTAPYERQDGESKQSFEAFALYRDMGLARSLAKVGEELGKSTTLMERWSSKYEWVERCKAYDQEMDRIAILENEQQRREMIREHAEVARKMLEKVKLAAEALKPETLTPNEMAKWLDIAVKVERLSRGESTDISEVTHSGEVSEKHEHNIFKRVDQYAELYEKMAQQGTAASSNESDDY